MPNTAEPKIDADIQELQLCTKPAIFVFLRHFACDACRKHALYIWNNRQQLQEKGACIHFIGNGAPHFLAAFKKQFCLEEASFFTDPSLRSFRAAGFKKGFWIDPGSMHTRPEFLYKALRFTAKKENAGYGNVWQLGGILVVRPGGIPSFQYISMTMDDFPPVKDIPALTGKASRAASSI